MSNLDKLWGGNIRAGRAARGMSVQDLAELLGVTTQTIYRYETGDITPPPAQLLAICRAFGERDGRDLFPLIVEDEGPVAS